MKKSKEYWQDVARRYYYRHREKILAKRRERMAQDPVFLKRAKELKKVSWRKNHQQNLEKSRARARAAREEIITFLGGKCATCGETNIRFLHIDKITGGKHNKALGHYKKHPEDYQILCANHHYEKTYYQIHNKETSY